MGTKDTKSSDEMRIIAIQAAITAYAYNHEIDIIPLAKKIYAFLMGML